MDRILLDYIPDVLRGIREFRALLSAEQPEAEHLWDDLSDLLENQFLGTSGEYGTARWERMLGISAKETESMEERKFRISVKLAEKLPYTWRRLEQRLTELCGAGGYTMELHGEEYRLLVRVALESKSNYDAVREMVERMAPANLILDLSLLYNQHKTLGRYTNRQLAERTHRSLRNEPLPAYFTHQKLAGFSHSELSGCSHRQITRGAVLEDGRNGNHPQIRTGKAV